MEENAQHTDPNRLTARQQRLVLRAVVGSLVISAALAAPHAPAQTPSPEARDRYREVVTKYPYHTNGAAPLMRVLIKAVGLHRNGLISSGDTFEVAFEARRDRDGSLHDVRVTSVTAVNPRWPDLMRELIAAVGESRLLAPLEKVERLSFTFRLDDRRGAFAGLNFEAPSAKRASQLKDAYTRLLELTAPQKHVWPEGLIFGGASATANGKQFALTLEMPREQLGNLLSTARAIT